MYKLATFLTICVLALSIASVAQAQENSPMSRPPVNIKAQIQNRIEKNREVRNTALEHKNTVSASTTIMMRRPEMMRPGSTTDMFKKNAEIRKEIAKKMEVKQFEMRKNALLKELTNSISNLTDISARIDARLTKVESEGRVVTEARTLLVAANDKLTKAKADVAAFQASGSVTASTTAVTASTTAQVDLAKPRVLGDAAIKSVKEARDAFQKVVTSIAHAMGLGKMGSTTPSQTSSHTN